MTWARYVAIGDSFTEGLGDPSPAGPDAWRGWADRVAEALSEETEGFGYANLAIRGRLLNAIIDEQLPQALALEPDLVSISGGGNDLLRPGADVDALANRLDGAVRELREAGADVILFTGADPADSPIIGRIRPRLLRFNERVREIAEDRGAHVVDQWELRILRDWRMWDTDRLHMSPRGHHRVALAVQESLGLPVEEDFRAPLAPLPYLSPGATRLWHLRWARTYLTPWVARRLRGRSSGDLVTAKRPVLAPISDSISGPA
ncbi:SGNH/GDSL hydrolase family protein [Actinocorallia longicatena]|uniref:SGNH/GDSL hydrolase family protein n=1 Tax=Actinocorallia longicatena TaxID=111803 RepID=A0ABP6QE88_9ACTN